jgi:hypothetical protein
MNFWKPVAAGVLFALLSAMVFATSYHWAETSNSNLPVVVIENYGFKSDEVKAGDELTLQFTMTRNLKCQSVTTLRSAMHAVDGALAWAGVVEPRTLDVGQHQVGTAQIPVPDGAEPGDYLFQAVTHSDKCPDGRSYTAVSPMLPFRVVK